MALSGTSEKLLSKFRGCLAAAVAGNVLGLDFEFGVAEYTAVVEHVQSPENAFSKRGTGKTTNSQLDLTCIPLVSTKCWHGYSCSAATTSISHLFFSINNHTGKLQFAGDTAMARSIAESLIKNKGYNARDIAGRFAREYVREPFRGYGRTVVTVFDKLLDPSLEDVYKPAKDQFDGKGSYGNGGAMRVAPVALFAYHDFEEMQRIAKETTLLTHSHCYGYNGAILQCAAVHLALRHDGSPLDSEKFINTLVEYMDVIEGEHSQRVDKEESDVIPSEKMTIKPYCVKLKKVRDLMADQEPTIDTVVEMLGNGISAHKSVPTAIYSFLHCLKPTPNTSTNGLVRTITHAISLGGDTDTIATMAGAIAGAYYGMESIPENWKTCCEGMDDAVQYANQFYEHITEKESCGTYSFQI
ncbi:ADP-ribosylhydrolase ARH3-like [Glandiceps talaboti]